MANTIIPQWKVGTPDSAFTLREYSIKIPSSKRMIRTILTVGIMDDNSVKVSLDDNSVFRVRQGEVYTDAFPSRPPSLEPNFEPQQSSYTASQYLNQMRPDISQQELGYLLAGLPDEPTRQVLRPLIRQFKSVKHVNTLEEIENLNPAVLFQDDPWFPIPPDGQVYAVPIAIDKLDYHDKEIGWTKIQEKSSGQYIKAKVYRGEILDEDGNHDGYNFKICLNRGGKKKDRVVGFMQINPYEAGDDAIHVSLMGNIDPRFTGIGQALEAIKVLHMLEVGAERAEMQTSWKAVLSHAAFNPNATFVPPALFPAKKRSAPESYFEDRHFGEDPLAVMSLNYYNQKEGGMVDSHGIFHESGQPFTRYGEQMNLSHVFMEYLDIAPGKFDEDAISSLLTRTAFEISLHKGFKGRLKFEADTEPPWCEEVPSWKDGARVTDNGIKSKKDPRRDPEIFHTFVVNAVKRNDLQSLCQWGSFEIIGQKADEIAAYNKWARTVGEPEIIKT